MPAYTVNLTANAARNSHDSGTSFGNATITGPSAPFIPDPTQPADPKGGIDPLLPIDPLIPIILLFPLALAVFIFAWKLRRDEDEE